MIGLIVTGHANFASGITSSVNLVAGEQEAYRSVDFLTTYGLEELTEEITKAIDELKDCESIIIFTDLRGGTPFNVAAQIGHGKENIRIIAGTNLPMLVEIVMLRKVVDDVDALVETAIATGKEQVLKYEFKKAVQEETEDGI